METHKPSVSQSHRGSPQSYSRGEGDEVGRGEVSDLTFAPLSPAHDYTPPSHWGWTGTGGCERDDPSLSPPCHLPPLPFIPAAFLFPALISASAQTSPKY